MAYLAQTFTAAQVLTAGQMNQVESNITAARTHDKGAAAPPTLGAGLTWLEDDNPSATVWTWQMYDGADWIKMFQIDTTNNLLYAGWEYIESLTASASASLDFESGLADYDQFMLVLTDFLPAVDNAILSLRVSDDAGGTYEAGASDYEYMYNRQGSNSTTLAVGSASQGAAQILMADNCGSGSDEVMTGTILFGGLTNTGTNKTFRWTLTYFTNAATPVMTNAFGAGTHNGGSDDINGVQLFYNNGNIASGIGALYGLRK